MTAEQPEPAELQRRIAKALGIAPYAQYDGAHHKTWVADQMVRALLGCPVQTRHVTGSAGGVYPYEVQVQNDAYRRFLLENPGWDEGIAP